MFFSWFVEKESHVGFWGRIRRRFRRLFRRLFRRRFRHRFRRRFLE